MLIAKGNIKKKHKKPFIENINQTLLIIMGVHGVGWVNFIY